LEKTLKHKRNKARRLLDSLASLGVMPDTATPHGFDLGCGLGAFLDVLQDRGWKTTGLEPAYLREFAGKRHTIIDEIPQTAVFNLVNVNHVLEHVLFPGKTLEALARASVAGAVLLCSVPDLEGLPRHRDLHYVANQMHINAFTGTSLATALRRTGWRPVSVVSGASLPQAAGDDITRLSAVAVRDARADTEAVSADPLLVAENALRAYGRLLGPDGKVQAADASG
jgi:SAM-dependent methyltransferase